MPAAVAAVVNPAAGSGTGSGRVTLYAGISGPSGITAGPDGALWFTEGLTGASGAIGRITTTGKVSVFADPRIRDPEAITKGPDGALWFINSSGTDTGIGRITTGGKLTMFRDRNVYSASGITAGRDGALWFTGVGVVGRISTGGTIVIFTGDSIFAAEGITAGPDGALWFTNYGNNTIGRITPPRGRDQFHRQGHL